MRVRAGRAAWGRSRARFAALAPPHPALRAIFSSEREKGRGASRRDGALDHRPHDEEPVAPTRRKPRHAVPGPGLSGQRDARSHDRGRTRSNDAYRSEKQTYELKSIMHTTYDVF